MGDVEIPSLESVQGAILVVDSAPSTAADEPIPCARCGAFVPLQEYARHVDAHEAAEIEFLSSHEPVNIAVQAVEMLRKISGELLLVGYDICNFDICAMFVEELQGMMLKHGECVGGAIEIVYHWTKENNTPKIVLNNLRLPGEKNDDGSPVTCDNGSALGHGIYTAENLDYGRRYGCGASCALLCLTLPGHQSTSMLVRGQDSLKQGAVHVYRRSAQLMPLFLANEDNIQSTRQAAQTLADFLRERSGACMLDV